MNVHETEDETYYYLSIAGTIVAGPLSADDADEEREQSEDGAEPGETVELIECTHADLVRAGIIPPAQDGEPPVYPEPGSEIPGQPGYVVGTCGHRVAASEWRAGFRTCERCPGDAQDGGDDDA